MTKVSNSKKPLVRRDSGEEQDVAQLISNWVRVPTAVNIALVGRSTLYPYFDISGGPIKTACIRKRGATRGIRMVNVPSLLAWLDSHAEDPASGNNVEPRPGLEPDATFTI